MILNPILVVLAVLALYLANSIKILPEYERGVIFRFAARAKAAWARAGSLGPWATGDGHAARGSCARARERRTAECMGVDLKGSAGEPRLV